MTARLPIARPFAAFGLAAVGIAAATAVALALPARTTSELNVRLGPSTDTTVLYTLGASEIVEILSCGSGWCKLDTGGFVSEAFLTSVGDPEPAQPAASPAAPLTSAAPAAPVPSPPAGYDDGFAAADGGSGWGRQPFASAPPPAAFGWPQTAETRDHGDDWRGWQGARSFLDAANGAFDDFADAMDPYGSSGSYDPGFDGFDPGPDRWQYGFHDEPEGFPFAFGIESATRPPACFYERTGYDGRAFCKFGTTAVAEFPGWWDDRISSIYVSRGWAVQACTGAGFSGYCRVFTDSSRWVSGALDNQITSYRVFRR